MSHCVRVIMSYLSLDSGSFLNVNKHLLYAGGPQELRRQESYMHSVKHVAEYII